MSQLCIEQSREFNTLIHGIFIDESHQILCLFIAKVMVTSVV